MKVITVLGATGSIGESTLDVLSRQAGRYVVHALTANSNLEKLLAQCRVYRPKFAVIGNQTLADKLQSALHVEGIDTQVLVGESGLKAVSSDPKVDIVMAAIVGAAGLVPTIAAAEAGKRVLLANKEVLVMAGELFMKAAAENNAEILPVDSEHNAIFQCLEQHYDGHSFSFDSVRRVLLTASGGPFLDRDPDSLREVTPDQACNHPNWSMGRKISVDSATMMNKGLEYIEALYLFGVEPSQLSILIHPQSVIHSMVEYIDGSILAQMGYPDMRTPIAHALAWPIRIESGVEKLDFTRLHALTFQEPCDRHFPCLALAEQAIKRGGTAPAVLNAANEVAVAAFLEEAIAFTDIAEVIARVLDQQAIVDADSLNVVLAADKEARSLALRVIEALQQQK